MAKKWKNYGLWVSLFSLVGLLLSDFGKLPGNYNQYVEILLSVLIMAGIVSNPNDGSGYIDHQNQTKEFKSLK